METGVRLQAGQIVGHSARIVLKNQSHGAVDVEVEGGSIVLARSELLDAAHDPADIFFQLAAVASQLFLDAVDQCMRQHVNLFENHLIDVFIAVVAGLAEYRHGRPC